MDHQDWNTVIIKGKNANQTKTTKVPTIQKKQNGDSQRLGKLENNDEIVKLKTLSKEQRQVMINGRVEIKLNQKQLATRLNLPLSTIQGYETGKKVIDNKEIMKIEKCIKYHILGKNIGSKM